MSQVTKHRFKAIDTTLMHLLNQMFKCKRCIAFNLGNESYSVNFLFNKKSIDTATHMTICIDNRLHYNIAVNNELIRNVFGDYCSIEELNKLPEFLKNTVLETAAEAFLDRFDRSCDCHSVIIESHVEKDIINDECCVQFDLLHENKSALFNGSIKTNYDGMAWLLEKLNAIPKVYERKVDHIPLTVTFELGYAFLNIDEIKCFEVNDIILLDEGMSPEKSQINVNIGNAIILNGRIVSSGNVIINDKTTQGVKVDMEHKDNKQMLSVDSLIEEISVKLTFKVGEKQVTFAELMDLQPGYTFEMDNCLEKPVNIDTNGKLIGIGELVEIGDRIGVRVLEIKSK